MGTFDAEAAAATLTEALRPLGTPGRAAQEKRYLKSDLEFLGVGVPDLRRTVKAAVAERLAAEGPCGNGAGDGGGPGDGGSRPGRRRIPRGARLDRETAVGWALALWREAVHERRVAAIEILQLAAESLTAADLGVLERLIRESHTWAYVDALAGSVAGGVALRDPAAWARIDAWAADSDFWLRRSALLALLQGIRAGTPDLPRFARYADPMLGEKEFFIRKAIGWVLREISRRDPGWTSAWTQAHISEISGVTFREAVRHLPAADRSRLEGLRARRDSRARPRQERRPVRS